MPCLRDIAAPRSPRRRRRCSSTPRIQLAMPSGAPGVETSGTAASAAATATSAQYDALCDRREASPAMAPTKSGTCQPAAGCISP